MHPRTSGPARAVKSRRSARRIGALGGAPGSRSARRSSAPPWCWPRSSIPGVSLRTRWPGRHGIRADGGGRSSPAVDVVQMIRGGSHPAAAVVAQVDGESLPPEPRDQGGPVTEPWMYLERELVYPLQPAQIAVGEYRELSSLDVHFEQAHPFDPVCRHQLWDGHIGGPRRCAVRGRRPPDIIGHDTDRATRRCDAARQRDLDMHAVRDAVVLGQAADLAGETLLRLDRDDLRPVDRGPDREQAAVGAEIDDPAPGRHPQPGTEVDVPAVHLARTGGVAGRQRDNRAARCPEERRDPPGRGTGGGTPADRPDIAGGPAGQLDIHQVTSLSAPLALACSAFTQTSCQAWKKQKCSPASPSRMPSRTTYM